MKQDFEEYRAVVAETVKLHGTVYLQGGEYLPPFPKGFDREIKDETGTIKVLGESIPEELPRPDQDILSDILAGASTDVEKKARLKAYAMDTWDVEIDGRKSLTDMKTIVKELISGPVGSETHDIT